MKTQWVIVDGAGESMSGLESTLEVAKQSAEQSALENGEVMYVAQIISICNVETKWENMEA